MVLAALPALGVLKGNLYALNGLVLYTFASGLIMTVLMLVRASQIRKAKSASEKELLLSKQEIELEKNRREEQSHLLHMLMHELKNPMAIIDMAMLAKNDFQATKSDVHDAVGSMKSILERCVNADKLTEGNVAVHIERVNVSELLCDLLVAGGHDPSRVALDVADELAVQTDVQYFQIMCSNLIDNAVRYGDPLMPVLIQAQRQKMKHSNWVFASLFPTGPVRHRGLTQRKFLPSTTAVQVQKGNQEQGLVCIWSVP